ncbi:MAG: HAD family hydrolase [Coprobacillaceae bacterium]
MNIKAIMCDVDGTLLNKDGIVSPKKVEAIKKDKKKGILFGLSTGRDVHSVKSLMDLWGINVFVDSIV